MAFTVFSFGTSLLLSTVVLLLIHILRRNTSFVKGFGAKTIVLGYALCLFRMVFTPEFHFGMICIGGDALDQFYKIFYIVPVYGKNVSLFKVFLAIWAIGACVVLSAFMITYIKKIRQSRRYSLEAPPNLRDILLSVQGEYPRKIPVDVFICPGISTPMGIGIVSRRILLPLKDFSEHQLYHMIKHEYTHFYNHDLQVKFLVMLVCCVFWWNPLVYVLRKDVSQMLEVKCDLTVTEGYSKRKKKEYLSVIMHFLKEPKGGASEPYASAIGTAKTLHDRALPERFNAVLYPEKKASKKAQVVMAALFVAVFALSYTIVLQPQYDPPVEEAMSDDGSLDPTLAGYIWKDPDGNYFMCSPGEDPWPIKKETAEVFASTGIEIKEEIQDENQTD